MSAGEARYGRRDNGLVAAEYAAAGDVDPRVGEHLLDVLALDGIAAYLRPSTDLHPVTRSTVLPSRPTDRLFVDRAHVETARGYLTRLASEQDAAEETDDESELRGESAESRGVAEPTSEEVDRAWAEIIAGFDTTAPSRPARPDATGPPQPPEAVWPDATGRDTGWPDATWPDTARSDPTRPDASRPDSRADQMRPDDTRPDRPQRDRTPRDTTREPERHRPRSWPADEPSLLDGLDTFGADLPDDGDETFTPPVAPPVPRPSLPTVLAVIGVIGGLAVFLKPDLLSFIDQSLSMFLGFTAIVSGFGTLVWRLRPGDDSDEDPDDGAKV